MYIKIFQERQNLHKDQNFCMEIVSLEGLISISSNLGTFIFEDKCLIPQLKVILQVIEEETDNFFQEIEHLP